VTSQTRIFFLSYFDVTLHIAQKKKLSLILKKRVDDVIMMSP